VGRREPERAEKDEAGRREALGLNRQLFLLPVVRFCSSRFNPNTCFSCSPTALQLSTA
jgi:hypothetical protein